MRISRLSTKRGLYGRNKVRGFTTLSESIRPVPARQLVVFSGASYYSLAGALSWWCDCEYVDREPTPGFTEYSYILSGKGRAWLRIAAGAMPNYQAFIDDMADWRRVNACQFERWISLPFSVFIIEYTEAVKRFELVKGGKKRFFIELGSSIYVDSLFKRA